MDEALSELGLDFDYDVIGDIPSIAKAGIMNPPALVINGKVKFKGEMPPMEDVKRAIDEEL